MKMLCLSSTVRKSSYAAWACATERNVMTRENAAGLSFAFCKAAFSPGVKFIRFEKSSQAPRRPCGPNWALTHRGRRSGSSRQRGPPIYRRSPRAPRTLLVGASPPILQMADVAAQHLDLSILLALQFGQPDFMRFLLALQSPVEPMAEQLLAQKAPGGQKSRRRQPDRSQGADEKVFQRGPPFPENSSRGRALTRIRHCVLQPDVALGPLWMSRPRRPRCRAGASGQSRRTGLRPESCAGPLPAGD